MINDTPRNLATSWLPQSRGADVQSQGAEYQSSWLPQVQPGGGSKFNPKEGRGPTDRAEVSAEASEPDGDDGTLSPLLQGLQGWGTDPNFGAAGDRGGSANAGQVQGASGSAAAGQGQPPSQVPEAILRQVLNTLKTAGGMATVGALQSLLSWGSSELENSGKIRPEFKDILHEAIDFAKENRIMSPEDLAKYESRLFADDQGGAGKDGESGGCQCSKGKGKSSVKDSLQAAKAA